MMGSIVVSNNMSTNATAVLVSEYSILNNAAPILYVTKALNNTVPSYRRSGNSTNRIYTVRMVGDSYFMFSYLRFIPSNFTISVGDTVEFVNDDIQEHIVAFGSTWDSIPHYIINNSLNQMLVNVPPQQLSSFM